MDDTFVKLHSDENAKFLRHIDAVDLNIQFALVNISDNKLSFSDCLVTINTDRTLSVYIFREKKYIQINI